MVCHDRIVSAIAQCFLVFFHDLFLILDYITTIVFLTFKIVYWCAMIFAVCKGLLNLIIFIYIYYHFWQGFCIAWNSNDYLVNLSSVPTFIYYMDHFHSFNVCTLWSWCVLQIEKMSFSPHMIFILTCTAFISIKPV